MVDSARNMLKHSCSDSDGHGVETVLKSIISRMQPIVVSLEHPSVPAETALVTSHKVAEVEKAWQIHHLATPAQHSSPTTAILQYNAPIAHTQCSS